jgi:hypothetical protein
LDYRDDARLFDDACLFDMRLISICRDDAPTAVTQNVIKDVTHFGL